MREEWVALLLVVVTVPALPVQHLELLRGARALRLLRIFRLGAVVGRSAHRIVRLPRSANSQLAVAVASFLLVTLVSAVLVLGVEKGRSNDPKHISGMDDALWWAISTVSTVGYGDLVPTTNAGRLLALIPMIAGVLLVGVVVSNFASRLYSGIERRLVANKSTEAAALHALEARLADVSDRLARLEATTTDQPASSSE